MCPQWAKDFFLKQKREGRVKGERLTKQPSAHTEEDPHINHKREPKSDRDIERHDRAKPDLLRRRSTIRTLLRPNIRHHRSRKSEKQEHRRTDEFPQDSDEMVAHGPLKPAHERQTEEVAGGRRAIVVVALAASIADNVDGGAAFPERGRLLRRVGLDGIRGLDAAGVPVGVEVGAREGFPRLVAVAQGGVPCALHRAGVGGVADSGGQTCALHGFVEVGVVAAVLDGVGRVVGVLRVGWGGGASSGVVDSIVVRGRAAICAWTRRSDVH